MGVSEQKDERVKTALEMHGKGYNCAQSTALALYDLVGLDRDQVFAMMEGFGAGMGLPNMKKNTDEMEIETEVGVGTTIHMKVYVA